MSALSLLAAATVAAPVMIVPILEDAAAPASDSGVGALPRAVAAPFEATPECQRQEECAVRGEPRAGFRWICDAGQCVEQAAERQSVAAVDRDERPRKRKTQGQRKR
jgi:hypothetical protein